MGLYPSHWWWSASLLSSLSEIFSTVICISCLVWGGFLHGSAVCVPHKWSPTGLLEHCCVLKARPENMAEAILTSLAVGASGWRLFPGRGWSVSVCLLIAENKAALL